MYALPRQRRPTTAVRLAAGSVVAVRVNIVLRFTYIIFLFFRTYIRWEFGEIAHLRQTEAC